MFNLTDKVLLLTGASGGIGGAVAEACAKQGMLLVIGYNKHKESADALAVKLAQSGAEVFAVQADVGKKADCLHLVDAALARFGRVDVLVNNAGFLHQQPFLDVPEEEWDLTLATNLKAPFLLSQAVFPGMIKNGGGKIINMASVGGQFGGPLAPAYAASKAGLICLTKSLARLGAPHGIIVNAVAPGLIVTEMTRQERDAEGAADKMRQIPMGRAGLPEEVANYVVFLASDMAAYATGQTFNVNGGFYMG